MDFKNSQKLSPVRQTSGNLQCYHQGSLLFTSDWQDGISSHYLRHNTQKKKKDYFFKPLFLMKKETFTTDPSAIFPFCLIGQDCVTCHSWNQSQTRGI